jgi:Protein of unknown function (DUF3149)
VVCHCPASGRSIGDDVSVDPCQCVARVVAVQWGSFTIEMELPMKALTDLFSTDYGLFSIAGIAFMIGMSIWFYLFFQRKMNEAERNQP